MIDKDALVKKQIDLMLSRAYWKGRAAGLLELKSHYMNDLDAIIQKSEGIVKEVENELRKVKDEIRREIERNQNTERSDSENDNDAPETNKETGE